MQQRTNKDVTVFIFKSSELQNPTAPKNTLRINTIETL